MNLYVPELGSKLILTEDWSAILYDEYRNNKLFTNLGLTQGTWQNPKNHLITFPKGTILTPRRVYIRQGASQYSSITFSIAKKESPDKRYWGVRFWVSLNDANEIKFELSECNEELRKSVDDCLYDIKQHGAYYNEIETLILEKKTVNTFRPVEEGYSFYMKAIGRVQEELNKYKEQQAANSKQQTNNSIINNINFQYYRNYDYTSIIDSFEKALGIMNKYFRKYKISKFIEDNTEDINEKETV